MNKYLSAKNKEIIENLSANDTKEIIKIIINYQTRKKKVKCLSIIIDNIPKAVTFGTQDVLVNMKMLDEKILKKIFIIIQPEFI